MTSGGGSHRVLLPGAGSIEPGAATGRAATGQGRQPIPVIVLARLAVGLIEKGQGLGERMLLQALARSAEAASLIGIRAVLMHANNGAAKRLCPV